VLTVLQPAASEAAVLANEQERRHQDEILLALKNELEAARYAAHRAEDQFNLADPNNRLVASELERRWNLTLQKVQETELSIERQKQGQNVSVATLEEFNDLARNFEGVWNHPASDAQLKRRIIRTLIDEVVVDTGDDGTEVIAVVHWKGGVHTELRVARLRRGQNRAQNPKQTVEAVRALARICSDEVIAGILTRNGLLTGKGNRWTHSAVTSLRSHHNIPRYDEYKCKTEGWLNLTQAASHLGVSGVTLRIAIERGEIEGEHPLPIGPWIIHRYVLETPGAAQLLERARGNRARPTLATDGQGFLDLSIT
jgi:hypothetical protein